MRKPNVPILVASVLVSLLLWVLVGAQTSQYRYVSVELQPQGLDEERFFVRSLPRSVPATLRGSPSEVNAVASANIQGFVDFRGASPEKRAYPLIVVPERVRQILTDVPRTVPAEVEPIVQKRVAVAVESTGDLDDQGYVLENLIAEPATVLVRGPKSEVDRIAKVRAVADLDTVDPGRATPMMLDVTALTEANGTMEYVRTTPLQVQVTPTLSVAPIERSVFVQPNFTGRVPEGFEVRDYSFSPREVTIVGSALNVARIANLRTERIDLTGLTGTTTVEVAVATPSGVRARPRTVRATVRVVPKRLPNPPASTAPPATTGGTPP